MTETIETVIVGGGQAGLSASYYLKQGGREHIVLEQAAQAAEAWRNHRWDSFTLVTPNWMNRMPGAEYDGDDPDGFLLRREVVEYLESYIERFNLPVRYNVRVTSVEQIPGKDGYQVATTAGDWEAQNVIIATGNFQEPKIPLIGSGFSPEILQLHSSQYRNPGLLPAGSVLVVGTAQSGCQIAEELYQSGRKVYLCVGNVGRVPRRYRGKEITYWMDQIRFFDRPVEMLPNPQTRYAPNPQISGKGGGHSLNLHQFARDGVVLLGHLRGVQDGKALIAPDLNDTLAKIDQFEVEMLNRIDDYIAQKGLNAPEETVPVLRDAYQSEIITELELRSAGITSVIWATGYKFDFSLVKLPVFDGDGFPVQVRGGTTYPGLFFLGLLWLHLFKSSIFYGVGDDAGYIVNKIVERNSNSS
jgi:putative flavoprotein involved in K+ transport